MKNIADIDPNMAVKDPDIEGITWYSPLNQKMFMAYGSEAFYEGDYARLSKLQREEVEKISPAVEFLSKWCAGLQLKFKTNSSKIMLDVTLRNPHHKHKYRNRIVRLLSYYSYHEDYVM